MPGEFVSRFTTKFVEIVGAGIATAITGYLIAHVGGYFSQPAPSAPATPAVVHMAPAAVQMAPPAVAAANAPAIAPVSIAPVSIAPVSMNPAPQPAAAKPEASPPAAQPARTATAPQGEPVPAAKPQSASIEAEVRAALAKVDALRRPARDARPRQVPAAPSTAAAVAPPIDAPTGAAAPRAAAAAPQPQQAQPQQAPVQQSAVQQAPVQQSPIQLAPPVPVEISSHPIASVDAAAAQPRVEAEAQPQAQDSGDKDIFSVFKLNTERLRSSAPVPADQAPRPPLPVGQ
jgi:hypothetical protein